MANPTTNFGWVMPTSTDLVTDLPADFNVFGQGVDTSMAGLKGGTTGQILSKTSATDMAFTWIANDQGDITAVTAGTGLSGGGTTGAVSLAIDTATTADLTTVQTMSNKTLTTPKISNYTTAGDLVYGTGSSVITRLGIGSTGQVLTVSGGAPVWASVASSKFGQIVQTFKSDSFTATAGSSYTDVTGMSVSITPTVNTSKVLVQVSMVGDGNAGNSSAAWQLVRGSTAINLGDAAGSRIQASNGSYSGNTNSVTSIVMTYLDSPATTSATTYKIQGQALGGTGIYVNRSAGDSNNTSYARYASSITVTEILA